jgi:hypothetical protein
MSVAIISAVVAVGTTAYGLAESSNQKRRGRNQQKALQKEREILDARDVLPTELAQNQQLGKIRSNTGLPSEQYTMAQKAIQRQQARTLKSASDRRMGLGLLASIDDNANRAQGNLDSQNAQARLNNERTLMGLNKDVASWKTAKVNRDLNQWNQNMDYARAVEGSGRQNQANTIMSGINAAGLIAGAAYKGSGDNSSWANGLFGNGAKARSSTFSGGGTQQPLFDANGNRIYLT